MAEWKQNYFTPKFPEKVLNTNPIFYRSSYEERFMNCCDLNKNVIKWGSEIIVIPYINEVDGRPHRYITDFYTEIRDVSGNIIKCIIEVKPENQSERLDESGNLILPKEPKKKSAKAIQNYINKVNMIRKNHSKWKAAREYCRKMGYHFQVITEQHLFSK